MKSTVVKIFYKCFDTLRQNNISSITIAKAECQFSLNLAGYTSLRRFKIIFCTFECIRAHWVKIQKISQKGIKAFISTF